MAIQELNEEQIRTWTLEEKDRWWLENVYRGSMAQLTLRSALTGMMLGGILSLTNLYVGAKTGWTLGVGITSVILAFAMFKVLSKLELAREFTILENNAMQSIATAAGYMTSPLISSLAAYMMVTGHVIPMYQTILWMMALAILGVLFAFPFKRRFINDEQQPFPEGRAAGVVMDSLHHGDSRSGLLKAKLLLGFAGLAALVKFGQSAAIMGWMRLKFTIPEFLDEWAYKLMGRTPEILGTRVTSLTLRPELDLPMIGAGGLMGIRTGVSLLIGAFVNYAILAPVMIQEGDISPNARGMIGFREITFWSLWCGVAMMTTASLVTFFAKPQILVSAFSKLFGKRESADTLGHIELPLWISFLCIPLLGAGVVLMAHQFFGIAAWVSVLAVVLVFFFCLIAINSTGLTSITPIGAMGKLTQLTFGAVVPGDKAVNLMTAGITGEVASHSANLLQDIKPGYMLGAKPRQQAMGHVLGVIAGAILAVPVFYLVFLKMDAHQLLSTDVQVPYQIDEEQYPMPSATVWKAVADVLAQGIENIKPSARIAAIFGIILGLVLEMFRIVSKNRFPLSPVAMGLGFVIPFFTCLSMFIGSFIFWIFERMSRRHKEFIPVTGTPGSTEITTRPALGLDVKEGITTTPPVPKKSSVSEVVTENQEPICAGLIAGGALMGIAVAVAELFL
jgi:putative OPT family oligopeptide transporter